MSNETNKCPDCGHSKYQNWYNCISCNKAAEKGQQRARKYCLAQMRKLKARREVLEKIAWKVEHAK